MKAEASERMMKILTDMFIMAKEEIPWVHLRRASIEEVVRPSLMCSSETQGVKLTT